MVEDNTKLAPVDNNSTMVQPNETTYVDLGRVKKEKAPNSIPALVLGGLSLCMASAGLEFALMGIIYSFSYNTVDRISASIMIVFAIISAVAAGVLALIGRMKTNDGYRQYNMSPDYYFGVGMLKAGKIMSMVGLIMGCVSIVISIIAINVCGM